MDDAAPELNLKRVHRQINSYSGLPQANNTRKHIAFNPFAAVRQCLQLEFAADHYAKYLI